MTITDTGGRDAEAINASTMLQMQDKKYYKGNEQSNKERKNGDVESEEKLIKIGGSGLVGHLHLEHLHGTSRHRWCCRARARRHGVFVTNKGL